MDLLTRFRRAHSVPPPRTEMVGEAAPDSRAAAQAELSRLEDQLDPGSVVRVLDAGMERFLKAGYHGRVRGLVAWAERELLGSDSRVPDNSARIASLYQRLGMEPGGLEPDLDRALQLYEAALPAYDEEHLIQGAGIIRNNMALLLLERAPRDPAAFGAAIPLLEESLEAFAEDADPGQRGAVCVALGDAYTGLLEPGEDHFVLAREHYERARSAFERAGLEREQAWAQERLGDIQAELTAYHGEDALTRSARHYRNALAAYRLGSDERAVARCLHRLADVLAAHGTDKPDALDQVIQAYEEALEARSSDAGDADLVRLRITLGDLCRHAGERGLDERLIQSVDHYVAALQRDLDAPEEETVEMQVELATARLGLAQLFLLRGSVSDIKDVRRAVGLLEEAGRIFAMASQTEPYQAVHDQLRQARAVLEHLEAE